MVLINMTTSVEIQTSKSNANFQILISWMVSVLCVITDVCGASLDLSTTTMIKVLKALQSFISFLFNIPNE